jgi:phospholipid-binding lipoprotein MlaA
MTKPGAAGRSKLKTADQKWVAIAACVVVLVPFSAQAAPSNPADPFEGMNRFFFGIHQVLDRFILRPAAVGYKRAMPKPIRIALKHVISNLGEPAIFVNDVLQGHGKHAVRSITRFAGNTTFGALGIFDVMTPSGVEHHNNDFGLTLARWGVGPGPYFFIPLAGPTTLRDGIGSAAALALNPLVYVRYTGDEEVGVTSLVAGGLQTRADADSDLKTLYASATDPYASFRSYFLQNRESEVSGGVVDLKSLPDFGDDPTPAAGAPVAPGSGTPDIAAPKTAPPPAAPSDVPALAPMPGDAPAASPTASPGAKPEAAAPSASAPAPTPPQPASPQG